MHIARVHIENIRGFDSVDLDFMRPGGQLAGWTVLAGRNGAGKSTLLKALALAVAGAEAAQKLVETYRDWIRVNQRDARVVTWLQIAELPSLVRCELSWGRKTYAGEPHLLGLVGLGSTVDLEEQSRCPFLIGYGPYRRLSGHATDAQRLMSGPESISRLVSLFREDSSLIECVQWLRDIYLRRLEKRAGAAKLEEAVLRLLNDGLLPGDVQVEGIDSEGLWVCHQGVRLSLDELSDGYRTVAALVMDIVRHLHRAHGELRVEPSVDSEGPYQRVQHSGVVLIDEVDLHLHVSWQKGIGFWLKRHFPNIQFIVTTHSPFVCQAADPRGLIRLPAPGEDRQVEHVSEDLYNTVVNGSADDAVLTELFGLDTPYSAESEKLRDEVARIEAELQTGKATSQDEQRLEELRSRLPQTPGANIEQLLRKLTADA